MIFTILIAFISLIGLMVLHEFGHFILAKKFGVKVEEFGIGYPPRIFGKKIGETIYSLNLLPFGAFVKIQGEMARPSAAIPAESLGIDGSTGSPQGKIEDHRSFSAQPIGKRALIVFGGVLSFWIIAAIIFSIVFAIGVPTAISDEENIVNSKVQIAAIAPNSPAQIAGLKIGDTIKEFSITNPHFPYRAEPSGYRPITKVKEIQEFTEINKGEEVTLTIKRGEKIFDVSLVPRVSPPAGEGAMGVALVRTAIKNYPWYQAPWQGILSTGNLTILIVKGLYQAISNAIQGLPTGVELVGPVGIGNLFYQAAQLGVNYFLNLLAMISIYLAIFNILPIPATDGGKLLFLGIEAIRKKPVSEKIEQNITAVSFALLLTLMVFATIKDIVKLF